MVFLEEGKDASFPTRYTAAIGQSCIDLILGNKLFDSWNFCSFRGKSDPGQGKIFQCFTCFLRPVIVETQQASVLPITGQKGGVFCLQPLTELRAFKPFGKPCGFFRKTVSRIFFKAFQIPGFSGFIA